VGIIINSYQGSKIFGGLSHFRKYAPAVISIRMCRGTSPISTHCRFQDCVRSPHSLYNSSFGYKENSVHILACRYEVFKKKKDASKCSTTVQQTSVVPVGVVGAVANSPRLHQVAGISRGERQSQPDGTIIEVTIIEWPQHSDPQILRNYSCRSCRYGSMTNLGGCNARSKEISF
jgi:hypothetical protein